jgi:hypothetical protein
MRYGRLSFANGGLPLANEASSLEKDGPHARERHGRRNRWMSRTFTNDAGTFANGGLPLANEASSLEKDGPHARERHGGRNRWMSRMFTNDARHVQKRWPRSNRATGGSLLMEKAIPCEGSRFRFHRWRLSFAQEWRVLRLHGACPSLRTRCRLRTIGDRSRMGGSSSSMMLAVVRVRRVTRNRRPRVLSVT